MPNRDGTGPDGKGPKTGQGLGSCKGNIITRCFRRLGFRRCKNNK